MAAKGKGEVSEAKLMGAKDLLKALESKDPAKVAIAFGALKEICDAEYDADMMAEEEV